MKLFYDWFRVMEVLLDREVEKCYSQSVSEALDITFSHCSNVIKWMEKLGWLVKEKCGRRTMISFTPKGLQVAKVCKKLKQLVEGGGKNGKRN